MDNTTGQANMEPQSFFQHHAPKGGMCTLLAFLLLGLALTGCGGGGGNNAASSNNTRNQLQGVGQKGPLVAGSTVLAYHLNANGSRTSDTITGQITDDKGNFSVLLTWTGVTELEATGQYLDETTCTPSTQRITLQNVIDSTSTGGNNLNLFSTLVAARAKVRLAAGDTLTVATATAHRNLKTLLETELQSTDVSNLDITDGASARAKDNAQLLLFSAALIRSGATNFTTLQADFADDGLVNGVATTIWQNIQTAASTANLLADASDCLESKGLTDSAPDTQDLPDGELPSWVNQVPVANAGNATTTEDNAVEITLSATDADNDTLTYAIDSPPAHGTLGSVGADGKVTYTPATDYNGADGLIFKVNDGTTDSNAATVAITVNAVDDNPAVAAPISDVTVNEDAVNSTISLGGVFSDVDGDSITLSVQGNTNPTLVTPTLSGTNLTLAYLANQNGIADIAIRATADSKTVDDIFRITVNAVNDAPVATTGITATTDEDVAVEITLSGTDIENDTLSYSTVAAPTHGTLGSIGADGKVTYTPAADYNGTDSFTFKANDGVADSNAATVNITLTPVDDAPTATLGNASTNEDTAVEITLGGSSPSDGTLTYSIVTAPTHGGLGTPGADGKVTYTPTADYNGNDSFTFKVNDGVADSAPATVTVTVTAVNDAPVATSAPAITKKNASVADSNSVGITLVGTDLDNSTLTYSVVTQPTHGALSGSGDTFTYTPATGYVGDDSLTFTVSDGSLTSAPATVSIAVLQALNDTGITTCGDDTQNGLACPQATHPGQDGDSVQAFNFTKFGADGTVLATQDGTWSEAGTEAAGTHWSCVKDNATGLVWEVKTNDDTLHDRDWLHNWYNPDTTSNGGSNAGTQNTASCSTNNNCDTVEFAAAVNAEGSSGLCGFTDWRMPTLEELRSIAHHDIANPAIDTAYFPNVQNVPYWTSQTYDQNTAQALRFHFDYGRLFISGSNGKASNPQRVMLVRGTSTY